MLGKKQGARKKAPLGKFMFVSASELAVALYSVVDQGATDPALISRLASTQEWVFAKQDAAV